MKAHRIIALGVALLGGPALAQAPAATAFKIVNLVSDQSGKGKNFDPNLVNAWGLAQGPGKNPIWSADNGTGLSTVYDQGTGKVNSLVVTIPKGTPTGVAYAPSIGFMISKNGQSGDSTFIFDSEAGVLSGWNSSVDQKNAVVAVDNSQKGAAYTGLGIDSGSKLLFAANFAQNQVEVYSSKWKLVNTFTDSTLTGYVPYNVAVIGGDLYVTFVSFSLGGGYVDVFSESGKLQQQLIANGKLNEPWGLAIAPSTFGTFAGSLLVGNLGDGRINAYDAGTGGFLGTLSNTKGKPLVIDGLWALDPVPRGKVTFSAGPGGYSFGLIGLIEPVK